MVAGARIAPAFPVEGGAARSFDLEGQWRGPLRSGALHPL